MTEAELAGLLEFLRNAERLKVVTRSAYTTTGAQESVAEHTSVSYTHLTLPTILRV